MSAIRSLLRVMTLRDAEAIILEAGKTPALRRRGQLEALAMPPIDPQLIADFAAPLLADGEGLPQTVPFRDGEGSFAVTIDEGAAGLRLVVRPSSAPIAPIRLAVAPPVNAPPVSAPPIMSAPPPSAPIRSLITPLRNDDSHRDRLAALLRPIVLQGRARGASDIFVSTAQTPRARVDGHLEALDGDPIDDDELAACVTALQRGDGPDVILLGELRDRETIAAALTAAETGHLVLATLHAPYAGGAIDRLLDAFPEAQQRQIRGQLALALRAIVTQHLVPRRSGGRAAAIELCPVTSAVATIIRKGELQQLPTVIQSGREQGMIPLERSLARLVEQGVVAPQVAKRFAQDHDLLAALSR